MKPRRWLAALCVVTLIAGACGDDDGSGAGVPESGDQGESSGTAGDGSFDPDATLRIAWTVPPSQLDPHKSTSNNVDFPYLSPVYDRLLHLGEDAQLQPMLATSWEFADDNSSLTFELRDDVTFHDGTPFTAGAVKMSLERALTLDGSTAVNLFSAVDTVEVVDDYTVRIQLNRPAADLPYALASSYGSIISPTAIEEGVDLAVETAGSGPYMITDMRPGDRIVYERDPDYWEPEAQRVARLELIGIADDNARLNALRSGQVEAAQTKLSQHPEVTELGEGFEVHAYLPVSWFTVYLATDRPLMQDPLVRQALNWAVDREAVNESILFGQCPPTTQPIQTGFPGHVEELADAYGYDPDRARELLAEAGHPDGIELELLTRANVSPQQEIAQIVQAQFAEAGIEVELVVQETREALTSYREQEADGLVHQRPAGADPSTTFKDNFLVESRFPGPLPEGFEEAVLGTFDATISEEERAELLEEASRIAVEQAIDLPICAVPNQFAYADGVLGMEEMGQGILGTLDARYLGVEEE